MPTEEELSALYQQSWNKPHDCRSETGGTDDHLANVYARRLAHSLGRKDFKGRRILDFGAGRGSMARALKALGAEVCAVEPYGHEHLRAEGIKAHSALSEVEGPFHGIVMIDVWEHLPQPWETLRELQGLLVENGWLYLALPNPLGLNARLTKGQWREAKRAGHLMFPSTSTMERMLSDIGFSRFKRLKWFVRYRGFPRGMLDYVLQATLLDGELRYLAWR